VGLNFTYLMWLAIAVIEVLLVAVRTVMSPGPVRLSLSLSIPALIIVGAIINAVYNRVTIGHALDDLPHGKHH
jgi:hypothetical protein